MNRKTKQFLTLILLTFSLFAKAQVYPVQITQNNLVPPYNTKLSSYTTATNTKLNLGLLLRDVNVFNRQIKLKLYIEGNGINIQSSPVVIGEPQLFLNGGQTKIFTNVDLRAYFEQNNLLGLNPQQYSRSLPEGAYKMCWEVYDYGSNQRISEKNCTNIYLTLNDPPILIKPQRGDQIVLKNQLNILFEWQSRSAVGSAISYEFEIRELWDEQIHPQAAFLASPPLYKETTPTNAFLYDNTKPALLPDKTYAWRVRAISISGLDENSVYKNDGYSEIFHFRLTKDCDVPKFPLSEAISKSTVKINWQGHLEHNKYHVQYRKVSYTQETDKQKARREKKNKKRARKGQKEKDYVPKKKNHDWFEVYTQNEQAQISNLEAGVTYEFRVGGTCSSLASLNQYYSYTNEHQFTMPTADETVSYNCGVVPDIQITNQNPLQNIGVNETFTAGDFPVTVKEVQGSNGRFTGNGFIVVPYLADTKIAVAFEGISINTNYQLIDGVVKTTYDSNWENVESADDFIDGLGDLIDAIYDTLEDALEGLGILDGDYEEENIDFEIEDIVVNENGETVIIGANGEEQNLGSGNNTVVTDENGNVIVVNEDGDTGAVTEDEENAEDDGESKETPYYVEVNGRTQQHKYNEKMYFVRQKNVATLYLKTSIDSLKFISPVWKIGSEVIAEGDTISIDLKELKSERIDITDSEDSEKKFKVKLKIYEKPITRFDLTVSNRNNFNGTFLFDDTHTGNSTSKKVLEDSGDYEEITNDLFHQDYSIDKKEKYFVPLVGTKLNQTLQLKVKLSSLNNSDPNFKVTLKPTSNDIIVGNQSTYNITSNNTVVSILIKKHLDENSKHYIEAYDQSNELVGKIEVVCKNLEKKEVRFVYIENPNVPSGQSTINFLSENDILNKLNNSSHNQLFKEWSQSGVTETIAIDSLAKYSLQRSPSNIANPTQQQIIAERNRIKLDHKEIALAYAYHKNIPNLNNGRPYTIMFLSGEFNGNTTASGGVSQVNGSNRFGYHTTIMYSTADMQTVAHEQGHDVGLPHIFCYDKVTPKNERGTQFCKDLIWSAGKDRKMPQHSALNNYMDYTSGSDNRNMFFRYQMENAK